MKCVRKVKIINDMGLHTRPATTIVKLLQGVKCHVTFTYKNETINAKSILSILMLAANKNSTITITAEGVGAEETLEQLVTLFNTGFGEV